MGQADLKRERQLAETGFAEGSSDPWKRIRNVLERGSAQLKDFEGTWPLVLVLHCPPPVFVPLDTDMVLTALHGNTQIVLDSDTLKTKRVIYSPDHSVLRSDHKAYLSAVAVIERIRPLEDEMNDEVRREAEGRQPTPDEWNEIGAAAQHRVLAKYQGLETSHEVTRMRIMHNPYCTKNPLPIKVFTGPHDDHWHYDRQAGRFVVAWRGRGLTPKS